MSSNNNNNQDLKTIKRVTADVGQLVDILQSILKSPEHKQDLMDNSEQVAEYRTYFAEEQQRLIELAAEYRTDGLEVEADHIMLLVSHINEILGLLTLES